MSEELDIRRQPGPHVFVADLDAAQLDGDDLHHLTRVLRVRVGGALTASDGQGRWRAMVLADGGLLEPNGATQTVELPAWPVSIAVALTKGAKPELVVQKATELGVNSVVVFAADHSVPQWDQAKQARSVERLARVGREAAMQSRQVRIPEIVFRESLDAVAASCDAKRGAGQLVRADFGGSSITTENQVVAIGPEGGWSSRERDLVTAQVDLGNSVLRAETAAIVAAAELVRVRTLGR